MGTRKIKKYDIILLTTKENKKDLIGECNMGRHLVLSVKPEGIKLFSLSSMNILDYSLKEFSRKYTYSFYS